MTTTQSADLGMDPLPVTLGSVLNLFGGPYVCVDGRRREVPEGSKRLLAFVALRRRRVERRYVAGVLWPDGSDERAAGNLRSALWRLRGADIDLLAVDNCSLRLRDDVVLDVESVSDWATRLIKGTAPLDELRVLPSWSEALDLLPGWYDDWVLLERERLRQRMLHALEALSRQLITAGRVAEAIEVALTAVAVEPLRESAQRALVVAHLAEGNRVEGRRCLDTYRHLLLRDLGVEPADDLMALVRPRPVRPRTTGWDVRPREPVPD
ncbi:DNA-binding transcriptional activator of the SARP family [Geodermatophilus dictyosporus]|uniref:DNA-binding transcriptional activator of the SARP family n=1 Tax=Geodermatophilus dictyosporus TaxID=1523247 RepID=A0A1I5JR18_9ACTN|nr:BTAD domain-containing putative transcriptional regulator [Geodermatophilus dictyosporus]SFO74953.1 DNA-binding transcriptional activator of the SARP family [Geodermatophilus dictyosporus]